MPAASSFGDLPRSSRTLVSIAEAMVRSGSRLEDAFWEDHLARALDKALGNRRSHPVESALEHLLAQRSPAYDLLAELAEARSESLRLEDANGAAWDVLLIATPCLAWTRYHLPEGKLDAAQHQALTDTLSAQLLAPQARLQLLPNLVRFDQLPRSFRETRDWTRALGQQRLGGRDRIRLRHADTPDDLLADAFFLIGAVATPGGEALFQWQAAAPETSATVQEQAARTWAEACERILSSTVFTGCQTEFLLPEAYYSGTRHADQGLRPLALKAAVTWLQTAAHIPATALRSAIVACGDEGIEEYRVGFSTRTNNEVIYGCVWPALNREESLPDTVPESHVDTWETIAALLRETGIQEIRRLPGVQPAEFCEDCGTPYFPDMLGEMQHPELPEEVNPEPVRFH